MAGGVVDQLELLVVTEQRRVVSTCTMYLMSFVTWQLIDYVISVCSLFSYIVLCVITVTVISHELRSS